MNHENLPPVAQENGATTASRYDGPHLHLDSGFAHSGSLGMRKWYRHSEDPVSAAPPTNVADILTRTLQMDHDSLSPFRGHACSASDLKL